MSFIYKKKYPPFDAFLKNKIHNFKIIANKINFEIERRKKKYS